MLKYPSGFLYIEQGGKSSMSFKNTFPDKNLAFTMAETLITLGIIGIVAAMTLPSLIGTWKDKQFKTAYKKAYSDLSQAFQEALANQELIRNTGVQQQATKQEFDILKSKFKVITDCPIENIEPCWKQGDTFCGGSCTSGNPADGISDTGGLPSNRASYCFVDASGRSWCTFTAYANIFLVDTNGFAQPNRFGKDRWAFTFGKLDGKRANTSAEYKKIIPNNNSDILKRNNYCKHPPCYYRSWLLD